VRLVLPFRHVCVATGLLSASNLVGNYSSLSDPESLPLVELLLLYEALFDSSLEKFVFPSSSCDVVLVLS